MHAKSPDVLGCRSEFKLRKVGVKDWKNAVHLLKVHDDSQEHNTNMTTLKDLEVRLAEGLTIDKQGMELADTEKRKWCDVLRRLLQKKLISAKQMCEDMDVEAELKQKRLRTTIRHFGYESPDEPIQDALRKIETAFF
ncbi:unnamed protein product [Lepeophtheirus salmonis]|uniref:(salmon louse) hypothetical protein n=1 Tax=Lepeophtheirus salmonis TaxID=72036 RepID=A0A7R8HA32_LEPSM|nr:unnamed protein product [Lepeophtheirus salmonis]CAF2950386.1 unnamed protein product [Lepeophtheirus salmonis]